MKKNNPLSVWTYSYCKSYYILHPWKWFYDTYWNLRNWIHRANRGYAYVDVWGFYEWYPRVGAEALRYLAKHNNGYPATEQWKTMEEWREYLEYLANRLQRCADSMDICFGEERNEYKDKLDEIMRETYHRRENDDGTVNTWHKLNDEQEEIRKKYWEREREIRDADDAYNKETWKWLAEDLGHFWD